MQFGPFRLNMAQSVLMQGETACRVGGRGMDILLTLVARAGEVVTKQELLTSAWPETFADEANLRVQLAALRKLLGDGKGADRYIVNVPGRGYSFVAPVTVVAYGAVTGVSTPVRSTKPRHNLPALLTPVIGRERAITAVVAELPRRRFVTIAGPGGVGKTKVAMAAAERLAAQYADGVWFIDLAAISDPKGIVPAIGAVLEFSASAQNLSAGLVAFLREKRLLLILDNCEHVVDAAATLVEEILRGAAGVEIMTTSREALRATGEWLHRLGPIELPTRGSCCTAVEAAAYPGVQIFVERATADFADFSLTDSNTPVVVEICHRLDGLPLAIELAASRVGQFGLEHLAGALHVTLLGTAKGRRTSQQRQQNLLAMVEWSYRLLSPLEQTVLRRLAVFRGVFTLDGAAAVGPTIDLDDLEAAVAGLAAQSLIGATVSGAMTMHRLFYVTRAFAENLLHADGGSGQSMRLHALYFQRMMIEAERKWESLDRQTWLRTYRCAIDDIRAALDWSFSDDGDAAIGLSLTASSLSLGFQLALVDEFRTRAERALLRVKQLVMPQPLAEMRLNVALATVGQNVAQPVKGLTPGFHRAVELSHQLDRLEHQVEPLIGMAAVQLGAGDYALAAELADRAVQVAEASGCSLAILAAQRVTAQVRHFIGDHASAAELALTVLNHPARQIPLAYNLVPVDRRVSMRIVIARVFWLQGLADKAREVADTAIDFAQSDSAFSVCQALTLAAIPIALWSGCDAEAAIHVGMLREQANRYTLPHWNSWATCFDTVLRIRANDRDVEPVAVGILQEDTMATFSEDLLSLGALQRADVGPANWCTPEIIRRQGELLLRRPSPSAKATAERLFQRARQVAQRDGSLAWELRAATSLVRLSATYGAADNARATLVEVFGRFTQGRTTADLRYAAALLDDTLISRRAKN